MPSHTHTHTRIHKNRPSFCYLKSRWSKLRPRDSNWLWKENKTQQKVFSALFGVILVYLWLNFFRYVLVNFWMSVWMKWVKSSKEVSQSRVGGSTMGTVIKYCEEVWSAIISRTEVLKRHFPTEWKILSRVKINDNEPWTEWRRNWLPLCLKTPLWK